MRVLHVVGNLEIGGITRFVEWMTALNGTVETHHDVLLGTSSSPAEFESHAIRRSSELHLIDPRRGSTVRSVVMMWRLAKKYDAFFIHTAFPAVVLPLILNRKACLVFQHGMMPGRRSNVRRRLMKWWYSLLPAVLNAKIVCSTPEAYEKVIGMGIRLRGSDVAIVPFGIRLSPHRSAKAAPAYPGTLTVGMAGRLVPQKRHELVVQSLAEYKGRTPIKMLIAGEGALRRRLKDMAATIKPIVNVELLGEVRDMRGFYDRIDLLLFPSRKESFGLVVPEAFDRCVPVGVFRDVGGCLSLVRDRENGFVLNDGIEGLTELWTLLDREPSILRTLSGNLEKTDLSSLSIAGTREELERLAVGLTQ